MCESLNQPISTGTKSESLLAQSPTPETATLSASNLPQGFANATAKTGSSDGGDLASCNPVNTSGLSSERPSESKGIGGILRGFDRILCLDFETSASNPRFDHVMQIGAAVMDGGEVTETFSYRISLHGTDARISLKAIEAQVGAQNMTPELIGKEVEKLIKGKNRQWVMEELKAFCFAHDVYDLPVVGHNVVYYDAAFWSQLLYTSTEDIRRTPMLSPIWVDTLEMARRVFPGSKLGLDVVCQKLDLPPRPGGHDALQDAILAGLAFYKMREML